MGLSRDSDRVRSALAAGDFDALSKVDWQLIAGMHPALFQIDGQFADLESGLVTTKKYIPANLPSDYIIEVLKKAKII
jgi:hypothetical protein